MRVAHLIDHGLLPSPRPTDRFILQNIENAFYIPLRLPAQPCFNSISANNTRQHNLAPSADTIAKITPTFNTQ